MNTCTIPTAPFYEADLIIGQWFADHGLDHLSCHAQVQLMILATGAAVSMIILGTAIISYVRN